MRVIKSPQTCTVRRGNTAARSMLWDCPKSMWLLKTVEAIFAWVCARRSSAGRRARSSARRIRRRRRRADSDEALHAAPTILLGSLLPTGLHPRQRRCRVVFKKGLTLAKSGHCVGLAGSSPACARRPPHLCFILLPRFRCWPPPLRRHPGPPPLRAILPAALVISRRNLPPLARPTGSGLAGSAFLPRRRRLRRRAAPFSPAPQARPPRPARPAPTFSPSLALARLPPPLPPPQRRWARPPRPTRRAFWAFSRSGRPPRLTPRPPRWAPRRAAPPLLPCRGARRTAPPRC